MTLVSLQPFDVARAELVASWAVGDEVVRSWCAVDGDRVPADVVAGWSEADDVEAYLLADDDGEPCAYGELWLDDEEGEVELARLLVAPEQRGRGVGKSADPRAHRPCPRVTPGAAGGDPPGTARERAGDPLLRRCRLRRRTGGRAGHVERGPALRLPLDGAAGLTPDTARGPDRAVRASWLSLRVVLARHGAGVPKTAISVRSANWHPV